MFVQDPEALAESSSIAIIALTISSSSDSAIASALRTMSSKSCRVLPARSSILSRLSRIKLSSASCAASAASSFSNVSSISVCVFNAVLSLEISISYFALIASISIDLDFSYPVILACDASIAVIIASLAGFVSNL